MPSSVDEPAAFGCCLFFFIVTVILFACSFDVLDVRFYGLIFDSTFKTVPRNDIDRENRDDSGRYLVGLGRRVVPFHRGLIHMSWVDGGKDGTAMECWTNNGQSVFLDISL